MARFIITRNALQCRSHHQKLEEKYTHINKIINLYKTSFNKTLYRQTMDHLDAITNDKPSEIDFKDHTQEKIMVDAEVQTNIRDVSSEFIRVEPNLVVIRSKIEQSQFQQPYYQLPPIYYPTPSYQQVEIPTHTTMSAPYVSGQFGWWGCYSPSKF